MLRRRSAERGDTIVEVMIVLAVLGLAIGIAYATANRSLLNARQAQENSQASSLVQSQIEALRTLATADNPQNIFQGGPFCLSESAPYTVQTGSSCQRGTVPYTLAITYDAPSNTFTVTATWPNVLGQGNDSITTTYRLYEGSSITGAPPPTGGSGGGGGGFLQPFRVSVVSRSCGEKRDPLYGSSIYEAKLYITGKPGDTITLSQAYKMQIFGSTSDLSGGTSTLQIGSDGSAVKDLGGSLYFTLVSWTAELTNTSQAGEPKVNLSLCP